MVAVVWMAVKRARWWGGEDGVTIIVRRKGRSTSVLASSKRIHRETVGGLGKSREVDKGGCCKGCARPSSSVDVDHDGKGDEAETEGDVDLAVHVGIERNRG